jgi:prevent-host-death family protein
MSISLSEDVKTLSELKQSPRKLINQLHRTGRPVVVTVKGKPDVVIMDVAMFERKLQAANLAPLLLAAETDVATGKTRPANQFLKELKSGTKKVRG